MSTVNNPVRVAWGVRGTGHDLSFSFAFVIRSVAGEGGDRRSYLPWATRVGCYMMYMNMLMYECMYD